MMRSELSLSIRRLIDHQPMLTSQGHTAATPKKWETVSLKRRIVVSTDLFWLSLHQADGVFDAFDQLGVLSLGFVVWGKDDFLTQPPHECLE